jgi:rhamnosyltransferase
MKEIDASIILLTLNAGEKFRKVLKAVFNQTYNNFEVIIIDSSSIDNTLEYAKRYPIEIFKIPRNDFGHGKTRNLGAKLARGRYLVYLTQDGIPANNNWLANLLVNLKKRRCGWRVR